MTYMDPTNNYVPGESGFVNRIADAASLQWMGLVEYAGRRLSQRVDEDYKAWEDEANRGYEDYMAELGRAVSADDAAIIRSRIDKSVGAETRLARHGAFFPHMVAALGDPFTWMAGPALRGVGFTRGLVQGAAATSAFVAPPELAAAALDPARELADAAIPIGAASLLGGGIGGAMGAFGSRGISATARYTQAVGADAGVKVEDAALTPMERAAGVTEEGLARARRMEQRMEEMLARWEAQGFSEEEIAYWRAFMGGAPVTPESVRLAMMPANDPTGMAALVEASRGHAFTRPVGRVTAEEIANVNRQAPGSGGRGSEPPSGPPKAGEDSEGDLMLSEMMGPVAVHEVPAGGVDGMAREASWMDAETGIVYVDRDALRAEFGASGQRDYAEFRRQRIRRTALLGIDWSEAQQTRIAKILEEREITPLEWAEEIAADPRRWADEMARAGADFRSVLGYRETALRIENLYGKTNQYPLQILEDLSVRLNLPSLSYLGHMLGADFLIGQAPAGGLRPVAAEVEARRWMEPLITAEQTFRSEYMRHLGRRGDPNIWRYMGTVLPQMFNSRRMGVAGQKPMPDGAMTVSEFSEAVSRSIFDIEAYNAATPEIRAAADGYAKLFQAVEEEMIQLGIKQPSVEARLRGLEGDLVKAQTDLKFATDRDEIGQLNAKVSAYKQALEELQRRADYLERGDRSGLRFDDRNYFMRMYDQTKMLVRKGDFIDIVAAAYQRDAHMHPYYRRLERRLAQALDRADDDEVTAIEDAMNYWTSAQGARGRAESTWEAIMKENDNPDLVVKHAFDPEDMPEDATDAKTWGSYLARTDIDLPTKELVDFLDLDTPKLARLYLRRWAPRLELVKRFGPDWMMEDVIKGAAATARRAAAEGGWDKTDAVWAGDRTAEALEALRDKVLGIYGVPQNPNSMGNRLLRIAKNWGSLVYMGKPFSMLLDISMLMARQMPRRVVDFLGDAITTTLTESDFAKMGRDRLLLAEALEMEMGNWNAAAGQTTADFSRAADFADVGHAEIMQAGGGPLVELERISSNLSGLLFYVNAMNPYTAGVKRIASLAAMDTILRASSKWARTGKVSKRNADAFASAGLTKRDAEIIAEQYAKHGEKGDVAWLANTHLWDPTDEVTDTLGRVRQALFLEANASVPTPTATNIPNFISNPLMSTLLQFQRFPLMATQVITTWGLQRRDMPVAYGALVAMFLGGLVNGLRQPDYIDKSYPEQFYDAFETAGLLGWGNDLLSMMEQVSRGTMGVRPLLGFEPRYGEMSWADQVGTAGPMAGIMADLMWAMTSEDATGHDVGNAIRWSLWGSNWWLTGPLYRVGQEAIEGAMGVEE